MSDTPIPDYAKLLRWDKRDPREEMAGLLTKAVGAVVIYYAMVEHWVDGIVYCIHEHVEGAKSVRKTHPYNAVDELQFLTTCLITLPPLEPFKDTALALLTKYEAMSELRHNVIHGHIRQIDWNGGIIEFSSKFKGDAKEPIRRTLTIQVEELYAQGIKIRDLIMPFDNLTQDLLKAFDPTYQRE